MSVGIEIVIILLLVLANGVFALSEIAIVSSRKARLQKQAEDGSKGATTALQLANDPGPFLATVQIGITLVGVLAGTFGGATLSEHLAAWLSHIPALQASAGVLSVGIVVIAITYLSLIVGELVPKRLGLSNPEAIASVIAGPMRLILKLSEPAVWFLQRSSDLILGIFGFRDAPEEAYTSDEISILVEQGTAAGVFRPAEERMVKGVFRLAERRASSIMTPRKEMEWLDLNQPMEVLREQVIKSARLRFPVGRGSLDDLLGIAESKWILVASHDGTMTLDNLELEKPLFVPEFASALTLLEEFKTAGTHIAMVVDEFGTIAGVVTPYDVLQAVVGDLPISDEDDDPAVVQRPDGSWLMDGKVPLDELKDYLRLSALPNEEPGTYATLAGYVVAQLGHVPTTAERFELEEWSFEVVDMDGHRVDKVLVKRPETPEE